MRRLANSAAAAVALTGCQQYASSPFDGFGGFIQNTHTFATNPNRPPGDAENIQRSEGRDVSADPLLPEPGNIWPGPPQPQPTLEDIIKQDQNGAIGAPGSGAPPAPPPPGSPEPTGPTPTVRRR